MHRNIQDFWHFSRRYRQFQMVSSLTADLLDRDHEVSEQARQALARLNEQRVACHAKIARLNLPSFANCGVCRGACCREPSDHYFTAIDFWLRKYTPGQVKGYRVIQAKPLHHYFQGRIRSALTRLHPGLSHKREGSAALEPDTRCAHLGENGCRLPHAERPVKCLIYACPGLKRSMDEATRLVYLEAVRELQQISVETFQVLKIEAGLPRYYGLTSLLFTF